MLYWDNPISTIRPCMWHTFLVDILWLNPCWVVTVQQSYTHKSQHKRFLSPTRMDPCACYKADWIDQGTPVSPSICIAVEAACYPNAHSFSKKAIQQCKVKDLQAEAQHEQPLGTNHKHNLLLHLQSVLHPSRPQGNICLITTRIESFLSILSHYTYQSSLTRSAW